MLKRGNLNVSHYVCLLNAEQAALDKKFDKAEDLYREAIRVAARGGYLHDAAIANERYADFLQNVTSSTSEVKRWVEEAIRFYREWGATHKVELLQVQYKACFEATIPTEIKIQ